MNIISEATATYEVVPQTTRTPMLYAGLWDTIAMQNTSASLIFPEARMRDDLGNGVVSTGWHMFWPVRQAFYTEPYATTKQPRKISLHEAQRVAVEALLDAEKRRRESREQEANFWAAMEDE